MPSDDCGASPGDRVLFYVNGARRHLPAAQVLDVTLLEHLRRVEGLTGAKLGCGEGGCGACTVLLTRFRRGRGDAEADADAAARRPSRLDHRAVNACLLPLAAADGAAVTTVEAIGTRAGGLHPVQAALATAHGSQCGFCTPGIVMSMYALLRQSAADGRAPPSERAVEHNFDGNLCRCTGYRPILQAFRSLVRTGDASPEVEQATAPGDGCCRLSPSSDRRPGGGLACCKAGGMPDCCVSSAVARTEPARMTTTSLDPVHGIFGDAGVKYPADKELLFPPELVEYNAAEICLAGRWMRPVTLDRLLELRLEYPEAKIVVGNTELGIEARLGQKHFQSLISCARVKELVTVQDDSERGLIIGAAVTWSDLLDAIAKAISARAGTERAYQTSSLASVRDQLRWFAGNQVRNVASVSGNIVTASPISDVNPVWIAVDAKFEVVDARTKVRRFVPARDFFVSYRKVDLSPAEMLLNVLVPWNVGIWDFTYAFKASRRREDDIAIVSAGIRFRLKPNEVVCGPWIIEQALIGLGGMAPKTIAATDVETTLNGAQLSSKTLTEAVHVIRRSLALPDQVPGGMPEYRLALVESFIFKAFCKAAKDISDILTTVNALCGKFSAPTIGEALETERIDYVPERVLSTGSQIHGSSLDLERSHKTSHVGQPVVHASAELQVTGEAVYVDDMPQVSPTELQGALVLSMKAHAKILVVDASRALEMPGVVDVVLAKDVRGSNKFGPILLDELCFAEEEVSCVGQVIGIVLANTLDRAEKAAKAVVVEYELLKEVVTIEDALAEEKEKAGSHIVCRHEIVSGNVDDALNAGRNESRTVTGSVRIGAQEHFYLEPNGVIVIPGENDEFTVYSSTQAATKTQHMVSSVLGIPMHKVVCKVKRIGGGFGGKETRSVFVATAAAVAAQKTGRPVRLILSRDVDMLTTGTRHAFLATYDCSYSPSGKVTGLDVRLHHNMGNTYDLSIPVMDRALHHCQNCYDIPNARFVGYACRTNAPSSTAFRGFGGPQGMLIAETVLESVAMASGIEPHIVRDVNLFGKHGNGHCTLVGMSFDPSPLVQSWDGVLEDAQYLHRKAAIEVFNATHRYIKRGISALPTMFGISFTFKTYNQAGALVHIYHSDGSVLVTHGGVEMGQGLHTKMCQVVATEFGLPLEHVFISETATDKVANTSPTAASASSDMYGMALLDACNQLNKRLEPVRRAHPEAAWAELINLAWLERVDLTAHGFYQTPCLDEVDLGKPGARGRPFFYYTNGAAVSEVEVDCLTGQHEVLCTHIVMDIGRPLNPAIDIGQIEGAFVQGLGWCTLEEVVRGGPRAHPWLRAGQMHTLGPGAYKIPGFCDIPRAFHVRVLDGVRNERDTIHSSKAVGEPPLFLAASAFFAIRHAIAAARAAAGVRGWFELDSPASVERIRAACPRLGADGALVAPAVYRPQLSL